MKRIAIFCDGTWNTPDAPFPTNVYRLHQTALQTADDGTTQLLKYIPGVGTGFGMQGVKKTWDKVVGGGFGVGVTRNLMMGYRFLAEHYAPGDKIYIFGFSRGAFTARSLAGMLRASGLPPHDQAHRVEEALRRYRSRDRRTKPDSPQSLEFRRKYSPHLATSPEERDWRETRNLPTAKLLDIAYLGVWDTVGALGVPGHYKLLAQIFNGSAGFHDTMLSRSVLAARHAVSIDERRRFYPPTLWDNLSDPKLAARPQAGGYEQVWFPGDHGSVGGGGDIVGLSANVLDWIAQGAVKTGLAFDHEALAALTGQADHRVPLRNRTAPPGLLDRFLRRNPMDRTGDMAPPSADAIATAAGQRWREDPSYRPPGLQPFAEDLG